MTQAYEGDKAVPEDIPLVGAVAGTRGHGKVSICAENNGSVSRGKNTSVPTLQGPSRAKALPQRRRTLYHLQAMRDGLPRRVHHYRFGSER